MAAYPRRSRNRDSLTGPHEKTNRFIPTFAARRHVELSVAEEIHDSIKSGIKSAAKRREIPQKLAKHCVVVPADRMCLTLIERGKMKAGILELPSHHPNAQMRYMAVALQQLLLQKATETGDISFEVGDLDRFGAGKPKRTIGAQFSGWRGPRRHYNERRLNGECAPISVITTEKQLCLSALRKSVTLAEEFSDYTMLQTPHLSLVSNPNGFRDHEFRYIEPIVRAAIPEGIPLDSPQLYLHNEPGSKRPREVHVTSQLEIGAPVAELPDFPTILIADDIIADGIDPSVMNVGRSYQLL